MQTRHPFYFLERQHYRLYTRRSGISDAFAFADIFRSLLLWHEWSRSSVSFFRRDSFHDRIRKRVKDRAQRIDEKMQTRTWRTSPELSRSSDKRHGVFCSLVCASNSSRSVSLRSIIFRSITFVSAYVVSTRRCNREACSSLHRDWSGEPFYNASPLKPARAFIVAFGEMVL